MSKRKGKGPPLLPPYLKGFGGRERGGNSICATGSTCSSWNHVSQGQVDWSSVVLVSFNIISDAPVSSGDRSPPRYLKPQKPYVNYGILPCPVLPPPAPPLLFSCFFLWVAKWEHAHQADRRQDRGSDCQNINRKQLSVDLLALSPSAFCLPGPCIPI